MVEPHFENAWIRPFHMSELKFLVQFMRGWREGRSLLLYKRIFFSTLTEKQ
jgi:hypothetical protein